MKNSSIQEILESYKENEFEMNKFLGNTFVISGNNLEYVSEHLRREGFDISVVDLINQCRDSKPINDDVLFCENTGRNLENILKNMEDHRKNKDRFDDESV